LVTGQHRIASPEFGFNLLTQTERLRLAPNSVIGLEGTNYSLETAQRLQIT
jgi:hypothetical protein